MNTPPIWRTEDALLLRQLRESAKTDSLVFARLNAISLAQLSELEGQGEGCFYNPRIKTNTGIKLLNKLGHQRVLFEESGPTEWSPPVLPTVEFRSSAVSAQAPQQATTDTNIQAKTHRTLVRWPIPWVGGMLVLGGLIWLGTHLPGIKTVMDPPPQLASTSTNATSASSWTANNTASKVADASASLGTQAEPTLAPSTPTPCDAPWLQASLNYEPTQPLKPGNYIYFSATQDTSLCVRDHKNQLTQVDIKAGASRSVYGEPPFLVHSPKWSQLRVFFQGRLVSVNLEDSAHWIFKKSPLQIPNTD